MLSVYDILNWVTAQSLYVSWAHCIRYLGNGARWSLDHELITNSKSYMGFWLEQKSMTLSEPERQILCLLL